MPSNNNYANDVAEVLAKIFIYMKIASERKKNANKRETYLKLRGFENQGLSLISLNTTEAQIFSHVIFKCIRIGSIYKGLYFLFFKNSCLSLKSFD